MSNRSQWVFRLFLAFLAFISISSAHSVQAKTSLPLETATIQLTDQEKAWLAAHQEIRLGYADSQEPQLIVNPDGTYSGIVVDLLDELNRRLGTTIRLEAYPVKALIAKGKTSEIDGICNLHPEYAERLGMRKSRGYFQNYPTIFTRRDVAFKEPGDMPGKTIAIIDKAYFSEKIIKEYEDHVTIVKVKSALEGLNRLASGDVDLFIGVSHNSYFISKYQLYDIIPKYIYTDYSDRVVMAIRSDWPMLVEILNKGLTSFADSELNAIVDKWVQINQKEELIVLTDKERDWLASHPDIELGYTDAFEPEIIVNEDGTHSGMVVDFLYALNKKLGTDFSLRIYAIPQLLENAQAKKVDGILNLHPGYAEQLGLLKTRTFWPGYPAVFARKGVAFENPDDFKGKRVAIIDKVYFTEKLIKQYDPEATILKVNTALEGLRSVEKGEADFFLGASSHSFYIMKYQLLGVVPAYVFLDSPDMFGIGVRSDWPQLVSIINKGIAFFSEHEINAIISKWSHLPIKRNPIELTYEERAWIAQNHVVRVRLSEHPPYMYLKNGNPVGISVDFLKVVSINTNITFQYATTSPPFSSALQGLINHEGPDLIAAINPTPERQQDILFTKPYVSTPRFIFTRSDAEFVSSLANFSGKTVAVVKNNLVHKELAQNHTDIKLLFYKNNEDALKAVSSGKAFAFIGGIFSTPFMINQFGLQNIKASAPSGFPDGTVTMGMRNDWPELRNILNKVYDAIPENEKAAMVNKWFSVKIDYGIRPIDVFKWILMITTAAFGLVCVFLFWNRSLSKKVTERTAKLAETERQFRSLVEQSPLSIQIFDTDGKMVQVNKSWEALWGISGKALTEVLQLYNVLEDQEAEKKGILALIKKAFQGETVILPVVEYDAPSTVDKLNIEGTEARKCFVQARFYPIKNDQGKVTRVVGIEEDITEQRKTEELINQLRNELLHTSRKETMGELSSAIAHELNQPLASIMSNTQAAQRFLDRENPPLDKVKEILSDVVKNDRRAGDIIRKLRMLLKKDTSEFIAVNINEVIEEMLIFTHSNSVIKNVNIEKRLTENLPLVLGDRTQLQQVLLNLVLNASDSLADTTKDNRHIIITAKRENEKEVFISVKDFGCGIDESLLYNLFNPFVTTKKEGMGMGLAITMTIIQAHGGRVWVENNPDEGATFSIVLPIMEKT